LTYRRRLSPVERVHAACGQSPRTLETTRIGTLVVEGEGAIDAQALRAAVARAAQANPGTRVSLRGHLGRARWEESADALPRVRVVEGSTWDGQGSEGAEVLEAPLELRRGPCLEVVLLAGDPCRLVVRALHAVTDGRGLSLFGLDVARALRGEEPHGHASARTDVAVMRGVASGVPPPEAHGFLSPAGPPAGDALGDVWRRVRIPGPPPRLLARVALAAARSAWRRNERPGEVRFHVPVDLRRHEPGLATTANMVGLATLDVPRDAGVEEVQRALRAQIDAGNHAALPRAAELVCWIPLRFIDYGLGRRRATYRDANEAHSSGMLTNMGRASLAAFGAPGFRPSAWFFLPIPGSFFVTVTGDDDGAELVVGMPRLFGDGGRLEDVCATLRDDVLA
jgi:hypothetical protein